MIKQSLEEWRAEAKERFGEMTADWKYECSRCGNVQSARDFVDAGIQVEEAVNMPYQKCIGREVEGKGCNWAAYGFLGTLGKGRIVTTADGREIEVFDFAPREALNDPATN